MDKFSSQVADAIGAGQRRPGPVLLPPRDFLELTADEVDRALRYDRPLTVILMTIDGFSALRNTLGNDRVESLFGQVRDKVLGSLRSHDRTGRLGRGELGALLPETTLSNAVSATDRLRIALADDTTVGASVSMGVAALSPRMRDPKTFLMTACFELRRAQSQGTGEVSVAEPEVLKVSIPRSGSIH
ncbi:MAG: diguanylate cyclase [Pseudomonadota bacterium]